MEPVPILGPRPVVQWVHDGARYAVEHGPLWDLITRGEILFYPADPQSPVTIRVVNPQKSWETTQSSRPGRGREVIGTKITPDYKLVLSGAAEVWIERTPRSETYNTPSGSTEKLFAVYQPIDGWNTMSISANTLTGKYRGAGGGILRDIIKGTLFVATGVGLANVAGLAGTGASVTGVAPGAVAVAPSEWAIATAGMGEGMGTGGLIANVASAVPAVQVVAPSEWAVATAGMGEGMGTGGILAAVPTLAQIGGAVQSTVQTVQQVASSIVGVAAAVETVKAAVHTPDTPIPRSADTPLNISPALIGVGLLLLVLVTVE